MSFMDKIFREASPELEVDEEELRRLVLEIDEEFQTKGVPVEGRTLLLRARLSELLKSWALYETATQKAAGEILESLYAPRDLAIRQTYVGAFFYKGSFYRFGPGIVYGSVQVNLDDFIVDFPAERFAQLRSDQDDRSAYIDQCCDVADFTFGFEDIRKGSISSDAISRLEAGLSHLQGASSALTLTSKRDGAMHSIFLSTEVLIKGALLEAGVPDQKLRSRDLGHNRAALIEELEANYPAVDNRVLLRASSHLPPDVHERYDDMSYSDEAAGKAIMAAQYVGGEIMRCLADRDMRASIKLDGADFTPTRVFP